MLSDMPEKKDFEERYKEGDTPWELDRPDHNLTGMVTGRPISRCRVLEIGCGTGANAVWLAKQGFELTACDRSRTAIKRAVKRAEDAGVECTFLTIEYIQDQVSGGAFGFVFDRGCFHSLDSDEDRQKFAENASSHLKKGGLWLSLIGNADEDRQDEGPPQHSAAAVVTAVEPFFEIISLASGQFDSNNPDPARAWICLMQKREVK